LVCRIDEVRRALFFAGFLASLNGTMKGAIGAPTTIAILEQQRNLTLLSEPMPGRVPS